MIHDFESGFFTHCLDFGNDLTDKAFFYQFRCQIGIKDNGCLVFCIGNITRHLSGIDQQIFFQKFNLITICIKCQFACCLQFVHGCVAVNTAKILSDGIQFLAVFRTNCTQLRFKAVRCKCADVICEDNFFDI